VVSFAPRQLYRQGKTPPYPLDRRLVGPQSRSGHGVEVKNSRLRDSDPDHPIVQPVVSCCVHVIDVSHLCSFVLAFKAVLQLDYMWVYPKVSGLTAWSENCEWYSTLALGAVVPLFYESV
jgi:hypothetical protein